jgi:hypothetical protein
MPLSGAWLEAKRTPDPQQAPLHQADPSHDIPGSVDPVPMWQAPPYQEVAAGPSHIGAEWVSRASGISETQIAPYEDGHEWNPGHETIDAPMEGRSPGVRAQHSDEEYKTDAFDGLGHYGNASEVSDAARRIGKNADPSVNPSDASYGGLGYRPGHYRQWNLWRKMAPPFRIHDQRVAALNVVTAIGDAPPPLPASPYNSPFSSLARVRRTVNIRPGLRRVPEQFDEAVISDGSEQPTYPHQQVSSEWVAG